MEATVDPVISEASKVSKFPSPKAMTKWLIVPSESDGTMNMKVRGSPATTPFSALRELTVGAAFGTVVSNVTVPDCPLESVIVFVVDQVPELVYPVPSQPPPESVSQTTPADPQSSVELVSVEVSNTRATTVPV